MRTAENRDFLQYGPKFLIFHQKDDFSPESERSHRALGMSDFDACATVGKEIVHIFYVLTFQGRHKYVHVAHKRHIDQFCCYLMIFVAKCALCVH